MNQTIDTTHLTLLLNELPLSATVTRSGTEAAHFPPTGYASGELLAGGQTQRFGPLGRTSTSAGR